MNRIFEGFGVRCGINECSGMGLGMEVGVFVSLR